MRKLLLLLVAAFATCITFSQTTILNNNFEGAGDDGWTMVNSATNVWRVGTVGSPSGGTKHAFISNDAGVTNTYTTGSTTASHLYRSVIFPATEGAILLSFDVRGTGEPGTTTSYDYIRVSLTTAAPVAGTVPAVTDQLPAYFSGYSTHKKVWIAVPASYAGLTRNLVFTFRCDNSGGDVSAGFAVDNITLTSNTVTALTGTKTIQSGGDYSSFGEAIANINAYGVNAGGLTLNVLAGATFNEAPTALAPLAGGGAIIFQKNGVGANPKLINQGTSASRVTSTSSVTKSGTAAVFALYGADNVTLDGTDLETAEFVTGSTCVTTGLGVYNISATDGATNNSFKNLNIKTAVTNTSTVGIHQNVFVTPTNATGANSNNAYKNLTISNSYRSILLVGNSTYRDDNTIITADPSYTTGTNTLGYNDLGNITVSGTSGMRGVEINGQSNFSVTKSEVRNIINTSTTSTNDVVGIICNTTSTSSNVTISNNLIHDITGSGTTTQVVYGVWFSAACVANISNVTSNKIYKITGASTTSGSTRGILYNNSTAAATGNIINNMIYQLENPNNATGAPAIRGIELNSAINVNMYHNTVYLNAAYTGTSSNSFQTSCLYMTTSTSTILDMKNNIFVNNSSTSSSGIDTKAVAFYKTTSTIGTQITTSSNNNLLYAGGASSKNLLYWGATAPGAQTLAQYIANSTSGINNGGGSRESAAVTENPPFISVTGTYDLHLNTALPTYAEGKGTPVGTVTTDIDGVDLRNVTTPDIGADEFAGTPVAACATPAAQPTALIINATGQSTASGSFTAASPAPSNYLVIRTTASSLLANPVDATTYTVGNDVTFGAGGFVESVGSATTISSTGLTAGTTYYYWIFSFNNNSCTGGPAYLTTSPLSGSTTTGAVFTSIASGNWEDGSTWNQSGAVPNSISDVVIAISHTVTVNAVNANANLVTVNGGGFLTVSASTLTSTTLSIGGTINVSGGIITNSGTVTNGGVINVTSGTLNVTASSGAGITNTANSGFTINGGTVNLGPQNNTANNRIFSHTAGILTVSSGTLNIAGVLNVSGGTFNQSGGNINVDFNGTASAATSAVNFTAGAYNLSAGTITIVDPAATTGVNAFSYAGTTIVICTGTHTVQFGDGASTQAGTTDGFILSNTSTKFNFRNLIINGTNLATNRFVRQASNSNSVLGTMTINANSEYRQNTYSLYLAGNLVSNGLFVSNGTFDDRLWFQDFSTGVGTAVTIAQTVSGSVGNFANATSSPTGSATCIGINNSNSAGVTFPNGFILTLNGNSTYNTITNTLGRLNVDAIVLNGSANQPIVLTAATSLINVTNLTLNNSLGTTLSGLGSLNVTGTVTPTAGSLTTGGRLVLKSSSTSTGRIAAGTGTYLSGTITQERFIPLKSTRRFSFITSPVSQALSAAWQQQIHITGAGTGGTACPTLTAHSNGFDATATNAPSMYSYDASQASGSRWVANTTGTTGFALMPGTGYRLNVRGPRTTGCALLDGTTTATTAVTLSATGVVSNAQKNLGSFSNTYNNNVAGNWVLIGNPYPSELDFTLFRTDAANANANQSAIGSSYIIYDPANAPDAVTPANMYSTWNAGTWSNAATSISGANGQYIANGQAFFVQATAATNLSLNFAEAYKASVAQNGVFRQRNWNDIIRIGLNKDAVNIDNTVVRYANDNTINNTAITDLDATLLSTSNSYLGTLKAGKLTSIQTRQLQALTNDTVALDFNTAASGNYSFNFSEHANFNVANIYLLDNYSKTSQEVKSNPIYSFTVDKNNAATQTNRFALVFSKAIVPTVITGIKVYPNPADKNITVQLPATEGKYTVSITDIAGKKVYQSQLAAGTQTINITKLMKGNYALELTDAKGNRAVEKIVKL